MSGFGTSFRSGAAMIEEEQSFAGRVVAALRCSNLRLSGTDSR